MSCKCLIVLLSLVTVIQAAGKDQPKFNPGAIGTFPNRQTNESVTVGARLYTSEDSAREAFGKVNPYRHGILPVLVIIHNDSGQALALDRMKVEFLTPDRERVEATPAADIRYLSGPVKPNLYPGPIPGRAPHISKKKNPLDTWEIEGRAFSAKMLPPKETASGFVYFQSPDRTGSKLYVTGIREASSGKELFYFEIPLDK